MKYGQDLILDQVTFFVFHNKINNDIDKVHPPGNVWVDSKGEVKEEIKWEDNLPSDEEGAHCTVSSFTNKR